MNFIKSWFSSGPEDDAKYQVERYLSSINLHQKGLGLTLTFQYQLNSSISQCQSASLYMQELVSHLSRTRNVSSVVKLFTIIHNAIYEREYQKSELECLEEMPMVTIEDVEENKWFGEFCVSYSSYLKKLPSVCDIYKRAKSANLSSTDQSSFLIQVFRIINQISLLFPSICTSTNVIGRYYITSYPEFPEFYRMLSKQITMVYSYLKLIIDHILQNYRSMDVQLLRCFMKTIPEIELTCDKIQDLLLNKYFKGKPIKAKIYLKEEKVQQLCYYLEYELQGKNLLEQQGQTLSTDIRRQKMPQELNN